MKIKTTRFGVLEVSEAALITLPSGLIGLKDVTRFAVVERDQAGWFQWWQAVDQASTAFITLDPRRIVPDYDLSGAEEDLKAVEAEAASKRMIATLVSLPENRLDAMTVNLLAPIVVNRRTREGRQIVLPNERYPVAYRMVSSLQPLPVAA